MGRLAHALPRVRAAQRRGRCASLPGAAVAAKTTAQHMRSGASAADVPPIEPKVSDWRGGRAGPITSSHSAARASGMAGDRGDDLADVQRTKRAAA